MTRIKYTLVKLAAKITGRKCSRCAHNHGGRCCHYSGRMFAECWPSFTRPGFHQAAPLTAEEQHQLQRIKGTLQEAGDTARDGGLLGE